MLCCSFKITILWVLSLLSKHLIFPLGFFSVFDIPVGCCLPSLPIGIQEQSCPCPTAPPGQGRGGCISFETVNDLKHMIYCGDASFATCLPLQIFSVTEILLLENVPWAYRQFAKQLCIFLLVKKYTWHVRCGMQSQGRKGWRVYTTVYFYSAISKYLTIFRLFIFKAFLCGRTNFLISVVSLCGCSVAMSHGVLLPNIP